MRHGNPKGLFRVSCSKGISDQYPGACGQMAQLKARGAGGGGGGAKEYGSIRLQDRSPLLNVLVMTLQLVGNIQKAGVFLFCFVLLKL